MSTVPKTNKSKDNNKIPTIRKGSTIESKILMLYLQRHHV